MLGKVALEEAYEHSGLAEKSMRDTSLYITPRDRERYVLQIHDITGGNVSDYPTNMVSEHIKEHRDHLGAFACLSMHDPVQAGQELRRCVRELGFHGLLLCDSQHAGPNGETYLFYGQPQYDAFWKVLTELDVALYIHTAAPADVILEKLYSQRPFLIGQPLSFANGRRLSLVMQGEYIPFDFWRINHWFQGVEKPIADGKGKVMCKKTVYDYFKQNI
ncbi:hypothetical protein CNMCM8980_000259 [Aspergillus fumigatiaffinis]|uniref:Amidohydrolase-related domain-containing protein n=1 Tax=Aspergillus fumigatiaffinis TaxID=340414 RepID=A0A8H4M5T2_9EURO|nr:hypothetical protein CNMCM5878_000614 [Aspergillus fumigatiaffinis]KAF4223251.1 hypothetical protein CNMCM6457_000594 [Aspergillus fumigatiaffinis]KAF4230851.1 hypothetical protein CNMCM6805_000542 [Aspergillus fumigatiaffinis]KAF4242887.1 hypothetical protein CNMCM8980_000259 [Aspergillus fumigatiaffinis]